MPLLADKILTALGYPLGMGLVLLAVALLLLVLGRRRMGGFIAAVTLVMLWTASMPMTASALVSALENQYPAMSVETYPAVEVAVVLGGGLEQPGDRNPYPDLQLASDRLLHAFRILKAGKASKLLVSGGTVYGGPDAATEAEAMASLLVMLGVAPDRIIIERESRNTFENARNTAALFAQEGFTSGLLVTSASHMPRALATFRKAGLALEPASTDINGDNQDDLPFPLRLLPDAGSLQLTSAALKEWMGLAVYRWRGWA